MKRHHISSILPVSWNINLSPLLHLFSPFFVGMFGTPGERWWQRPFGFLCFHRPLSHRNRLFECPNLSVDWNWTLVHLILSLKLTARTWKSMVRRWISFWGPAYFQVRTVSFRECIWYFLDLKKVCLSKRPGTRILVNLEIIFLIGFLSGGCPRGGVNSGTLRIPREDWGTLGKIRGIATPR